MGHIKSLPKGLNSIFIYKKLLVSYYLTNNYFEVI
jgi:hypothetical protein